MDFDALFEQHSKEMSQVNCTGDTIATADAQKIQNAQSTKHTSQMAKAREAALKRMQEGRETAKFTVSPMPIKP